MDIENRCDVAIAGVGLAGAMVALRLAAERPQTRVETFDRGHSVGAGRTWSFFETDPTPRQAAWLDRLVAYRWDHYEVRFPGFQRILHTGYRTISSAALDKALSSQALSHFHRGAVLDHVTPASLTVAGHPPLQATLVLDGRGAMPNNSLRLGYQKFLGQYLELTAPHGVAYPIIMDAQVEQIEGFRFIYVLPLSPTRLLVEDTRYTDSPVLDRVSCRAGIADYLSHREWRVATMEEEEEGVLPVVLTGTFDAFWRQIAVAGFAPPIGTRAGFFHHTTSYSVPFAVEMAERIAAAMPMDSDRAISMIEDASRRLWRAQSFYRFLNRMLFFACEPEVRWKIFRRFYELPEPLINRFYAARSTTRDKIQIVAGRPPVPLWRAVSAIPPRL